MSLWQRLFGPSKLDRVLDLWREERTVSHALLQQFLSTVQAQTELQRQQQEFWLSPKDAPRVRLMTPADEAAYEAKRRPLSPPTGTPIPLESLLDGFKADFLTHPPNG